MSRWRGPGRRALAARRRARDERGQSLVELVLALPILLVLVFGIIEFAVAWRTFQITTNVAREGARLAVAAATPPSTQATVQARIDSLLTASNLDPTLATVTYSCDGAPGLCPNTGFTGSMEEVEIQYPHTFVVFGPVMNLLCAGCGTSYGTITLTTRSVMRNE